MRIIRNARENITLIGLEKERGAAKIPGVFSFALFFIALGSRLRASFLKAKNNESFRFLF